ncbi:MAG: glutamate--tRNA ligase [Caldithrix sp.]|nr:glutamate--tRNA ligase [Caldithrix sp.]
MQQNVRFAPSPTGLLHVGGARTAIFNWLYARQNHGRFLLRIEDSDRKRSNEKNVQQITEGLQWLGLEWDNEIVFQSHQRDAHIKTVEQLLHGGKAYRCFCSKVEIEQRRTGVSREEDEYKYDGKCRHLSPDRLKEFIAEEKSYAIRFKAPQGMVKFNDLIHGEITIHNETIEDFILLRSDGTPTYNLAVVVDDYNMNITTVLRGDDHLNNTSKQILIYKAMNWPEPQFGHMPMILGPDKKRLSKRHGATAIGEFRDNGILPEAMFNYLCLLGWATGDDTEIMDRSEILQRFDINQINKSAAVFDYQKLYWMNGKYVAKLPDKALYGIIENWLIEQGYPLSQLADDRFLMLVKLQQIRSKTLAELKQSLNLFFKEPHTYEEKGVRKYFMKQLFEDLLKKVHLRLTQTEPDVFDSVNELENLIRAFAEENNVSAAKVIHPIRLALTGSTASPGIFELMYILNRQAVLLRIQKALEYIQQLKKENQANEQKP